MANAKDVAAVIQSALDEIGVTGQLAVSIDGQEVTSSVGSPGGGDLHVGVVVEDRSRKTSSHRQTKSAI
ncbi:MAG: hypothetical protein EOP64_11375 [Sphingomonas sp.]|nr:MAG: hypothetical protein EOP64_11375 [Sphingomonas sp.]